MESRQSRLVHPVPAAAPATDSFGCSLEKLDTDQALYGGGMAFFRKGTRREKTTQAATPASDRGFVIGVSLREGHRRRILHEHHAATHDFDRNGIYIRDHATDYKADLSGPFEFLLMEISPASLLQLAEEADLPGVTSLSAETASKDVVLANLARALLPALERPQEASLLFVDQMATAMGTYLVQRYGGRPAPSARATRSLSRPHEDLAKSILIDAIDRDIPMSEVAQACQLSRGYFIRAFRETTGVTPYRWLLQERVNRARELLRHSGIPLAEVAIACGFADQSHFTRVFSAIVGRTPGQWRRDV